MLEWLGQSQYFIPHGHCYLWIPSVLWLHAGTDAAIAAAYCSIALSLQVFVRRKPGLEMRLVVIMFAGFIFWCGLTHLMSIWVIWRPDYIFEGMVKAVTAAISVATAVLVWRLIPKALAIPTPSDLQRINAELRAEVARREQAEAGLVEANRRLQERVAELESFSYSISHDLRAPLRAIDGFSTVLTQEHAARLDQDGRYMLDRISAAARRMALLIDSLLAFVRLGSTPIELLMLDMRALAWAAAASVREQYPAVSIQVEALPAARGDPNTIAQVWVNLIGNAAKFSATVPDARVTVLAETGPSGEPVYCVRDNGVGFEMQHAHNLFRLFHRLHIEFEGTGAGLAVVKRIVERHGGRVWADAAPGQGATFRFTLDA